MIFLSCATSSPRGSRKASRRGYRVRLGFEPAFNRATQYSPRSVRRPRVPCGQVMNAIRMACRLLEARQRTTRGGRVDMDERPRPPDDPSPRRPAARRAAWCAALGVILGAAAVICLALGAVSVQQAIAAGLPAALLVVTGIVIAVLPDPATGHRTGFQAGYLAGSLLSLWRSLLRHRGNGY